jgi:hypothetical protein
MMLRFIGTMNIRELNDNEFIKLLQGDASGNLKETITHLNEVVVMNINK